MKHNEATVFVFFACLVLGVLISLNIGIGKKAGIVFLNAKQYQDAYNEKNRLSKEIKNLNVQYEEYYSKLIMYTESTEKNHEVYSQIQKELDNSNIQLGKVPVVGEGIIITLYDGDLDFDNEYEDVDEINRRLIHDGDLINIVNDLRNAGAEIIAVNDQRIISTTFFWCGGSYINIDGIHQPGPYIISAIGNKEVLKEYMLAEENYLKYLMSEYRGARVTVTESENIRISPYIGEVKPVYSKIKE